MWQKRGMFLLNGKNERVMRLNEEKSLHLDEENSPTPNPMKELKACNF